MVEWHTRQNESLVGEISWGFESPLRHRAGMAKSGNAADLSPAGREVVGVRVPLPAQDQVVEWQTRRAQNAVP